MIEEEAAVARAWDRNADAWTRRVRAGGDLLRERMNQPMFMAFLPQLEGREVIDLGCGEGSSSRILADAGARVTGIDLSEGFLAAAAAEEAARPRGIAYRRDSFTRLATCDDGSFDAAVSFMALMDGPSFPDAMRATARVLRSGGTLHFSVLHPCFWRRGSRWIAGGDGRILGVVVADYWNEKPYEDRVAFFGQTAGPAERFSVPRFPMRMEDYVCGVAAAGLAITAMSEPRPSEELAGEHSIFRRQRDHAPMLLYIAARKP